MTRAEFQRIYERMSAEISRLARAAYADLERIGAGEMSPREAAVICRMAPLEHARYLAACDQYDAAKREVPREWLPPGEEA